MGILSWIALGLVAGVIANGLMSGRSLSVFCVTLVIAIAGAMVGGYFGTLAGLGGSIDELGTGSITTAMIGAMVYIGSV